MGTPRTLFIGLLNLQSRQVNVLNCRNLTGLICNICCATYAVFVDGVD
jgi:hypothetical protein